MNFQITLLLTSFVYLDVITQQIPAVQSVYDTPMILLFFVIVLVMQVVLIVGKLLQIQRYLKYRILRSEADVNFVGLDWGGGAQTIDYPRACANCQIAGRAIAYFFNELRT